MTWHTGRTLQVAIDPAGTQDFLQALAVDICKNYAVVFLLKTLTIILLHASIKCSRLQHTVQEQRLHFLCTPSMFCQGF